MLSATEETTQNFQQPSAAAAAPSMDSLPAEAAAYGDDEAEEALECPCIAYLKKGPCGSQFSEAFLCFMKSTPEEEGSDCENLFAALQSCVEANPGAYDFGDESNVKREEEPEKGCWIFPPIGSRESPSSPGQSKL